MRLKRGDDDGDDDDDSNNGGDDGSVEESDDGEENDHQGGSEESGDGNNDDGDDVDDYGSDDGNEELVQTSPLSYFNISDCGTYSNMWIWDLPMSCDNSTSFTNCKCKCTQADILFHYGDVERPGSSDG